MLRTTALALGLLAAACSHRVEEIDPNAQETINVQLSFADLRSIANEMTQSFLDSDVWGGDKPRIVFGGVRNRTTEHVDAESITDTIRTALIQSRKFTVLASDQGIAEIEKETSYQQSGAVDQNAAVELGKQLGAEYVFYGTLRELRKERSGKVAAWYTFTLNAVNTQTRQMVWAQNEEVARMEEKSLFGW